MFFSTNIPLASSNSISSFCNLQPPCRRRAPRNVEKTVLIKSTVRYLLRYRTKLNSYSFYQLLIKEGGKQDRTSQHALTSAIATTSQYPQSFGSADGRNFKLHNHNSRVLRGDPGQTRLAHVLSDRHRTRPAPSHADPSNRSAALRATYLHEPRPNTTSTSNLWPNASIAIG